MDSKDLTAADTMAFFDDLKRRYWQQQISYEQAKAEAAPVIESVNRKATALAKAHNVSRPKKISFAAIMR